MARVTFAQVNMAGGEVSPQLAGRADLALYFTSASWVMNFYSTTQGNARYRNGTKNAWNTKSNLAANLVSFQYNTDQAYILEFTNTVMRIYKDGGIVTATAQDITGITKANPAVVTYSGADTYANGDSVIISGVLGMLEVNNREYIVANVNAGANTFELTGINSTSYGTYTSGGTVAEIIEVVSPYLTADLFEIRYAQTADTMYIVHPDYAPRKLTRSSHTAWTLSTYDISGNPFGTTKAASQTISGITKAATAVVTYVGADTYANGDIVLIESVVGMTEVNGKRYTVRAVDTGANTFQLENCDSTLFTAYTSGGTIEEYTAFSYPSVVAFFEQRLWFGASDGFPQKVWGSVGAEHDNFVQGTLAADGLEYNISSGQVNRIRWMTGTEQFLAVGTSGGEMKISGGGVNDPITPSNITVKQVSYFGAKDVPPILLDSHVLFLQRDGITFRTFEYDAVQDGYTSVNRTLTADQITRGRYGTTDGVKQMAYQSGNPSINWCVKNDGTICTFTFEPKEQVTSWHRQIMGGSLTSGKLGKPEVESVATIPQTNAPDQVYIVVKRTINGSTVRHVEYFADQVNVPKKMDYYTGDAEDDDDAWRVDMFEAQKRLVYLDNSITWDGTVNQTMTLGAVSGSTSATAGGATFAATDVGREIWGKAGGRATITAYTSSTVVTVTVTVLFPSVSIASGNWYLTASTFYGLAHFSGATISALADGAAFSGLSVGANGAVTMDEQHSYVTFGLGYTGLYKSNDLEAGGNNGAAVTKERSLSQLGVKMLESQGAEFGTNLYDLETPNYRAAEDDLDKPPPLLTGVKMIDIPDGWETEKYIYCVQDQPLPCNIQVLAAYMTTNDG